MPSPAPSFRFGPFVLRPAERQLSSGDREIVLRPKAFDTLYHLVRHHGHAVSKADLLDAVWPGTSVSDAVLTHCVAEVREALGDTARDPRYVKTVSKHGYKFVATVEELLPPPSERVSVQPAVRPEAGPDPVPPPSAIVVLPFANMSADADAEYLCDGLSEELINGLTKVGGLQVVAHSSSFSFKGRDIDAREIGRQLHVGTILEGSIRKAGDRLRVSAQLIDAARGYHLWCEQYDRHLEDVFALQDEIARAILDALRIEAQRDPARVPLFRQATTRMDAYVLYLQGRACWHQRWNGRLQQAMDCFGRAIAADPGFAAAYTGLADSLSTVGVWGFARPHDVFPKAATLADTARQLDPALAEAHASRALVQMFWDWDWAGCEQNLQRALDLNPGNALIRVWYGHYLSIVGRMDEAIAEMRRAQRLDPLSPVCTANLGWTCYLAHRHDEAIGELRRVLAATPDNAMALMYLGYALIEVGRHDEAIACLERAQAVAPGMPFLAEGLALAHGLAGRRERARAVLADLESRAPTSFVMDSSFALTHRALGNLEAMFDWLDRAVASRDVMLPWVGFMPPFDCVHGHPRFDAVLSRIGLAAPRIPGNRR